MPKIISKSKLQFAILAVDVVCFRVSAEGLSVLLGEVNVPPFFVNKWGVIGGLISPKETAEDAVNRHLKTKAGMTKLYKEQLYTFSQVDRDPRGRVVSVAYMALVHGDQRDEKKASVNTRWCPVSALPKLAYDHNEIVEGGVERLRAKIGYTNIAQHLLSKEFTLSELQSVYEVVLDREVDKRNFRKKVIGVRMVKKTGKKKFLGTKKPAALYSFMKNKVEIVEIL